MGRPTTGPLAATLVAVATLVGVAAAAGKHEGLGAAIASSALIERGQRGSELPRGGRQIFPRHRVIGFYGAPQSPQLGELGIGSPASAAERLARQARPYARLDRKRLLPAFELIATIALANPGSDGNYRARQSDGVIRAYLRAARRERLLLLLDIQPGRSSFIEEARHLKRWLREPNVGIALDPEWNMGPGGVPGERIGSVGASMINRVSRLMASIARRHRLPEKLLVVHQFTAEMVRDASALKPRRRVATVLNADGFGTPAQKRAKYRQLAPRRTSPREPGFKLFYSEDTDLMSPRQVMALKPRPRFVVYE